MAIFEHLLFSARLGVAKPDPAAFAAALDVIGEPASEVVFIDDRAERRGRPGERPRRPAVHYRDRVADLPRRPPKRLTPGRVSRSRTRRA